ncbi:MAG: ABC transporter substrate-binding protein [Bacteroidota bacterium]|nr:ABC transporter substrate-binding protein [Candidatus Kapabacteria bacterium]MCS7302514.1 ABC transporter substrate-binding protein [Candidatus Kapabacteria bacterium]MDW8271767.1 ABC transporter substrate-binding protein [Bacteroidota bacterium]
MHRHHAGATVGALLLLALLVQGCGEHAKLNEAETLRYNEPSGIASLDPAQASYQAAIWAGTQLFNGLVEFDSLLRPTPALAVRWSVDSTLRRWRFVLRKDVWFHEDPCFGSQRSRRCTAEDVRYSIERILDARTRSPGLWVFLDRLEGAREFHDATRRGDNPGHCRGIRVLDDTTVEFVLSHPFAPFLSLLAMPYAWIVPREAVEYYGDRFGEHPVGTGPFRIGWWKQDRELVLLRNDRYWRRDENGGRLPYLRAVQISFIRDQRTEFAEFRRGHLDLLTSLDPAFAAVVLQLDGTLCPAYRGRFRLLTAPALSTEYYGILLDTTLAAGKTSVLAHSRLVRQALNYAIDRERIVRYVLRGTAVPAHGVLPPAFRIEQTECYRYDPDRARRLLAEAGFPEGKGLPSLRLVLGTSVRSLSVAEVVQQQWAEIGVRVELQQVEFPRLLAMVRAGELALWRTSWVADYPDAENFLALFVSSNLAPNGPNTTRYRNDRADALYRSAIATGDTAVQRKRYREMERIVVDDAPWVFLYHGRLVRLVHPFVEGMRLDPLDRLVLERVRKRR